MSKNALYLLLILLLCSCSIKTVNEFYVLNYLPVKDRDFQPADTSRIARYKLKIEDLELNRIYDRNAIVVRESLHKMYYDNHFQWAYRPHKAITELLINHFNTYGYFSDVRNDYIDADPDYIIGGRINNIEKYQSPQFNFAYLDLDLYLRDSQRQILLHHKIQRNLKLESDNPAFFVKVISDILKEELNLFVKKSIIRLQQPASSTP